MESIEVFESRSKNLMYGSLCLVVGFGIFSILLFTEVGPTWLLNGFSVVFVVFGIKFFFRAFSDEPVLRIDDHGIWLKSYKRNVAWEDIATVEISQGMFVAELSNVNKHFADASSLTKGLSKRLIVVVDTTTPSERELAMIFDERFASKVGATNDA